MCVHTWGVYPLTSLDAHLIMATPKKLHLKKKYTSSTRMEYELYIISKQWGEWGHHQWG